jgi:transposase
MVRWTKANIPDEFKRLANEGKTYVDMRKNNGGLIWAIHRIYGGIIPFCDDIDYDYSTVVSNGYITKYKAGNASKEEINSAIVNLFSEGDYVKVKDIQSDPLKAWIYSGAVRHYDDWYTALSENGIKPYYNLNISEHEDEVISLYIGGKSGLEISRLTGIGESSIYELLKRNNIDADGSRYGIKPTLTKEDTMDFVKGLIKQSSNERLSTHAVKNEYPVEYHSIKFYYKALSYAVVLSGVFVLDKGIPKRWSKKFLIEQIKLGYKQGEFLNNEYLNKGFGNSAVTFGRGAFGSWENAVKAAGLNYEDIRQDGSMLAPLGHEFESVVSEILTDLNVSFKQYDHDKYRPDFVVNNEWIDAKLSQSTFRTKDDNGLTCVDKYEPYCDKLTIVFLRGNKECDMNVTNKTRLVNVYTYVNKLPEVLRNKYRTKLDDIERRADAV